MPGEMRIARNKFLHHVIIRGRGEAFAETLGIFRKYQWFIVAPFRKLWTFEGGHGANVFDAFLLNTTQL